MKFGGALFPFRTFAYALGGRRGTARRMRMFVTNLTEIIYGVGPSICGCVSTIAHIRGQQVASVGRMAQSESRKAGRVRPELWVSTMGKRVHGG